MSKKIKLTQNKYAIVDDNDYDYLSQFKWYASKTKNTFYAMRNSSMIKGKRKKILMHREIMQPIDGFIIDHINHNGLDNRKSNLRFCTKQQNNCNILRRKKFTSKYRGVHWASYANKWRAQITVNKKPIYLGLFNTEEDAAISYNEAAVKYHKDFGVINNVKNKKQDTQRNGILEGSNKGTEESN